MKYVSVVCMSVLLTVVFAITAFAEPTAVTPYYTWTKSPESWDVDLYFSQYPEELLQPPFVQGNCQLSSFDVNQSSSWLGFDYGDKSAYKALYYDSSLTTGQLIQQYGNRVYGFKSNFLGSTPAVPYQSTQSGFVTFWVYSEIPLSDVRGYYLYNQTTSNDPNPTPFGNGYTLMTTSYIGQHPDNLKYYGYTCNWSITNTLEDSMIEMVWLGLVANTSSYEFTLNMVRPPIAVSRMVITNGTWSPEFVPDNPQYLDNDTFQSDMADYFHWLVESENTARENLFDTTVIATNRNSSLAIVAMFNSLISSCPFIGQIVTISALVGLVAFILGLAPSIISHSNSKRSRGKKGGGSS